MILQYLQYLSGGVIAIAGFLSAILGIVKFWETFTTAGKKRVAKREQKRKDRIQEISKQTADTLIEQFKSHQEEIYGEIFSKIDDVHERLDDIENTNRAQSDMIKLLNEKVDKNEIDRIRYEILHFAAQCRHGVTVPTLDDFNHIFDIHKKYSELLKANNLTNGQMDVEYDFIIKYYNTLSRDGKL